jgi:exonuclease VII large subunit
VIDYKITQFESKISPLSGQLKENLEYALQVKMQNLRSLEEKMKLYDPKLKQKEGWAEVLLEGKRVVLSKIKKDEIFTLTDTQTKLEVRCTKKEKI